MSEKCDIIISSGAVSAGEFDFVKDGLKKMRADIIFHKVKLKPGKPTLFAILPNGAFYFGLPGNPVASAVGLRFFVVAINGHTCTFSVVPCSISAYVCR